MIATIDFETTGLKAGEDEVLQVSIIDENYNVLLNVYCRPNNKGRQYLKPDDIEEYKVKFDGAVHFLMHTEELKGAYENAERKR